MQRRTFLLNSGVALATSLLNPRFLFSSNESVPVYWVQNGSNQSNTDRLFELMGGIDTLFYNDDIIVIKPNCQWWNQGTANLPVMRRLIEKILALPSFSGEIIIAENHQKNTNAPNTRGWTAANIINVDEHAQNLNELIDYFNHLGHHNVTKYHWISEDKGGTVVTHPSDGDGYVRTNEYYSFDGKSTPMTYPVFTSSYSGKRIDLRHGVWANNGYTGQQCKLINFSSLNHHSSAIGVTASVKNLMGVVELPFNDYGRFPDGSYNFHSLGVEGMGGALGTWISSIHRPYLNIIAAEWVGWGGRIEVDLAVQGLSVLASKDPVALDYCASKYLLLPLTPEESGLKSLHDPDNSNLSLRRYLNRCHLEGGGEINRQNISIDYVNLNTTVRREVTDQHALSFSLSANPNPVTDYTNIHFDIASAEKIWLSVWSHTGRKIDVLLNGSTLSKGHHIFRWHPSESSYLPSGRYFVQLHSSTLQTSIPLVYIK